MESFSRRIPSLDGLRTLSIGLVIVSHAIDNAGFDNWLGLGNLGVRVFFVISGFLITFLLVREFEKNSTINLGKFYFRRTLRIFPPYYFYLAVIFGASMLGYISVPLKSLFYAAFYVSDYLNPLDWHLGHTWSLSVEEQFYLLFPGLFVLLGKRKTVYLLILAIVLSPFVRVADYKIFETAQIWVGKGFHHNAEALAFGCLLALFYDKLHQNIYYQRFLASKIVAVFPVIIVLCAAQTAHPLIYFGLSFSLMNILIVLCLDWTVTNFDSNVGKLLNSAPMIKLGTMSYSIYLWQQPFFNHDNPSLITSAPFNFIGLAVTALFSYYVVEKYSLTLRQKLEGKFFRLKTRGKKDYRIPLKFRLFELSATQSKNTRGKPAKSLK